IILLIISISTACIAIILATLPAGVPFSVMVLIIFIIGFCLSGYNGIWMNATTEILPSDQAGIASGYSILMGSLGVMIGSPLFGSIVDKTGSFTFGWLFVFLIMAIVTVLLRIAIAITRKGKLMK